MWRRLGGVTLGLSSLGLAGCHHSSPGSVFSSACGNGACGYSAAGAGGTGSCSGCARFGFGGSVPR